ncbi:MAG TPA: four helix bundle protein [Candidatus Woesebacteria bacterium]|nr:four helix bundle protein [Candidatus Woesebacteria bacterium]
MEKNYLQLNNIDGYVRAYRLSNYVWNIVIGWEYLSKRTIGEQFIRAVDSISANLAEGFGRYNKKDKIKFYHYSMGYQKESLDWNDKSFARNLLTKAQYNHIHSELNALPIEINQLIKFTFERLKK